MPHSTTTATLVNGDKSSSKFISHLTSYPVVHDGIETYKTNPYGKKSLEFADGAYVRFAKPVEPYFQKPYAYAQPYVQKADELGDATLTKVEGHFPIVKEDTHAVFDTARGYVWWPYNYVTGTFHDEYEKVAKHNDRGKNVGTLIGAVVSTQLRIVSDFFATASEYLGPKYDEGKKKGSGYVRDLQENAEHYKQVGQEKINEYSKHGQQKAQEVQKAGQQKADEAKDQAKQTKEDAKQTKEEAKQKAQK